MTKTLADLPPKVQNWLSIFLTIVFVFVVGLLSWDHFKPKPNDYRLAFRFTSKCKRTIQIDEWVPIGDISIKFVNIYYSGNTRHKGTNGESSSLETIRKEFAATHGFPTITYRIKNQTGSAIQGKFISQVVIKTSEGDLLENMASEYSLQPGRDEEYTSSWQAQEKRHLQRVFFRLGTFPQEPSDKDEDYTFLALDL